MRRSRHLSLPRFRVPEPPSLHRVPRGGSPASSVQWGSLTSCHPSGPTPLPSPSRTACAPPHFALAAGGRPPRQARIFGQPGPSPAVTSAEMMGSPRFLEEPLWTYAVLSDPGRAPCARPSGAGVLSPRLPRRTTPSQQAFRGSITRPSPSLSTLRRRPYATSTQDSLPAGGQPLPGRIWTCRAPR